MAFKAQLKTLSFYLLTGLTLTSLISCSNNNQSTSNNPVATDKSTAKVEFWTMQLQPQFTDYFNQLNNNFETKENQKIDWLDVPWSAMESKILTAVSAKTAPDVVNLNPSFASQLATRNAWLNLENKITPEEKGQYLAKTWAANSIEICEADKCQNNNFGIPWYLTTAITIYNQDLIKQANITKIPLTFVELAETAKQIKEKTGKYALFVTFVAGDSNEVLESFIKMGVTLIDKNGKATFNTPEGKEAFNYWVNLYQQDLLPKEVLTQGHRYGIDLYQAGEIAFLNTGPESLKSIENNAPSIYQKSAASPQITGKTGKKNIAVMNLVIPQDSDKPDEAIKYALFVTNADNQLSFAKTANVLPSHVTALEEYIKELDTNKETTPLNNARKISAIQIKDAEVLVPPIKDINKLQKIIYENLQAAMLKTKTVDQALTDAESEWNSLNN